MFLNTFLIIMISLKIKNGEKNVKCFRKRIQHIIFFTLSSYKKMDVVCFKTLICLGVWIFKCWKNGWIKNAFLYNLIDYWREYLFNCHMSKIDIGYLQNILNDVDVLKWSLLRIHVQSWLKVKVLSCNN